MEFKITRTNFADMAETVIKEVVEEKYHITNSQIRNILNMVNKVMQSANQSQSNILSEDEIRDIQYLKMRLAYECGRDSNVKKFVTMSKLDLIIRSIGNDRKKLELFADYMESLVAFHKFYSKR